jgi:uncharacterized protein YggT (Ycf19 family)
MALQAAIGRTGYSIGWVGSPTYNKLFEQPLEVHVSIETGPVAHREDVRVTQQPGAEQRQVVTQDVNAGQRQALQWITALIGFFFTLVEGLIGLRIILKIIDANSQNAFASLVYKVTALFVAPFTGLVGNPAMGGNVLEVTSIVALIVYALVAAVIIRLVWLLFYHPSAKTVTTYERDQSPRLG